MKGNNFFFTIQYKFCHWAHGVNELYLKDYDVPVLSYAFAPVSVFVSVIFNISRFWLLAALIQCLRLDHSVWIILDHSKTISDLWSKLYQSPGGIFFLGIQCNLQQVTHQHLAVIPLVKNFQQEYFRLFQHRNRQLINS